MDFLHRNCKHFFFQLRKNIFFWFEKKIWKFLTTKNVKKNQPKIEIFHLKFWHSKNWRKGRNFFWWMMKKIFMHQSTFFSIFFRNFFWWMMKFFWLWESSSRVFFQDTEIKKSCHKISEKSCGKIFFSETSEKNPARQFFPQYFLATSFFFWNPRKKIPRDDFFQYFVVATFFSETRRKKSRAARFLLQCYR